MAAGGSVSISNLFAAGFGPGILVGLVLMVICYFSSKKYGYGQKNRVPFSLHNVGRSFVNAIWALIMPVIVLGGWILTSARIPDVIASFMVSLTSSKIGILLVINIFLLIVGCLMDVTAAIIILTPIFLPIIGQFGIDPIHFGIIMTVNLAIGQSTPPLGVNLFVSCGIAKISIEENARAMVKFLIANIIALLLITYIEPISLTIPKLMGLM